MFLYKNQYRQAIPVQEERQREDFTKEALAINAGSGFDIDRIWFTDEAIFIWVVSLTYIICDLDYIFLEHNYCISKTYRFGCNLLQKHHLGFFFS
ncbi:hypothetical protein CDAR_612881 [Caerostris darwini]|uniref:Uncharacterized protein n=1 Tax=Caerostris darwini TaxID=1538125 RepID=A0AAV4TWB3_9ARAC|nr:hypothetical protein CDAR_612881 [Caerostris darwini]